MAKYEKARKLKDHIAQVRKDYAADMKSSDVARQQKGVTVYLIDRLALRVGGEKVRDRVRVSLTLTLTLTPTLTLTLTLT